MRYSRKGSFEFLSVTRLYEELHSIYAMIILGFVITSVVIIIEEIRNTGLMSKIAIPCFTFSLTSLWLTSYLLKQSFKSFLRLLPPHLNVGFFLKL